MQNGVSQHHGIISNDCNNCSECYFVPICPGKLIHSLNKNEHALDMATPLHNQTGGNDGAAANNVSVKQRTNVLLLGDHIGDLGMSDGLNYENRISVGFL